MVSSFSNYLRFSKFRFSSILALDHEFIDQELRKFRKAEKLDVDHQMEGLANLVQLRSHEPVMRKDVCIQLQVCYNVVL